jgi:hypothetical protein
MEHMKHMKQKKELDDCNTSKFVRYFNKTIRDNWRKDQKKNSRKALENILSAVYATIILHPHFTCDKQPKGLRSTYIKKLTGNYNYINCKIKIGININDTTKDKIIGTAKIGEIVWESIKEGSLRKDNLEEWLNDHLWLWGFVMMGSTQHNNVVRNKHTLIQKVNFKHYKNRDREKIMNIIS